MQNFFIKQESNRNLTIDEMLLHSCLTTKKILIAGYDGTELKTLFDYIVNMSQQLDILKSINNKHLRVILNNKSQIRIKRFSTVSNYKNKSFTHTTTKLYDHIYLIGLTYYKRPSKLIKQLELSLKKNGTLYIENIEYFNDFIIKFLADAMRNESKYKFCI